jgi:hypothetical protein
MDEVRLGCEALARRCEALDPAAWRSFAAAHDAAAARAGVAAAEAARRAGLRARALLDALQARGQDAPAATSPRPP